MKQIVLLGDRDASYLTHRELDAAITLLPPTVGARWVGTDTPDASRTAQADGVWVVPGSPYRNDEAVFSAITSARMSGQPLLGTCGGFQYVVVEFARNVAGLADAEHAETAPDAEVRVVERLPCSLVGEERIVTPVAGTRLHALCAGGSFVGFHWCNYGLAPAFADRLAAHGLVVSAHAEDAGVEAIELREHPFFMATLFQPQAGSLAGRPLHPIIEAFIDAV